MPKPITPLQSVSGYLHMKLDSVTVLPKDNQGSKLNALKITASVTGGAALLVANSIETVIRYLIAYVSLALSYALKDKFTFDCVDPAFKNATTNKKFFFHIKNQLKREYDHFIKPFLKNPVKPPEAETPKA